MLLRTVLVVAFIALLSGESLCTERWLMPPLPPPEEYGNLLINRTSEQHDQQPVAFSHWMHRVKYTCRVCHFELDFMMETNATEITEEGNRAGEFCGACHDGKVAFGHTEDNCEKCHSGNISSGWAKFDNLSWIPEAPFGNQVDWAKGMNEQTIKPRQSIFDDGYSPMDFNKILVLEAEWELIPPAIFPHETHNQWLDCSNCHPDVFNIKKKTTRHFEMRYILKRQFCGACHLNVAFPLDDCRRCHPALEE